MKTIHLWTLFALAIVLLLSPSSAAADAAPPPPPAGSDIYPSIGNTNVRMVSEYVLIDVLSYSDNPLGEAKVTAQFFMKNLGEETENMQVRFPMFHDHYQLEVEKAFKEEWCIFDYMTPEPLSELTIWINGSEVSNEISYMDITLSERNEDNEWVDVEKTVPCWSHFDVSFPPGETVEIKVSYFVSGYPQKGEVSRVRFPYVLTTGAGWYDTIGEATVIARLPYPITELNYIRCYPEDCIAEGNEIIWHYEDFVPEQNIDLTIDKPSYWLEVLEARENVANNPNDGEAWGRLGKAYKELMRFWDFLIPDNQDLYELSKEAYLNATALLPDDPDWHYGFAELLCYTSLHGPGYLPFEECVLEIKYTLDLEPDHQGAWELITIVGLAPKYISISGTEPVFKILTPKPATSTATITNTPRSTSTITSTPTPTTPPPTSTRWPSYTPRLTASPTLSPAPTNFPSPQPTPAAEQEPASSSLALLFAGTGIILLIIAVVWYTRRK